MNSWILSLSGGDLLVYFLINIMVQYLLSFIDYFHIK